MPSYKYTYFDVRGRGETPRLIFAAAGVKYEDNRIQGADWPGLKPNTPFGTLPFLEVDGKTLGQSLAICRYLAVQFGLSGQNSWDQAQVDALADTITDIREKAIAIRFEKDEAKKTEKMKDFMENGLPNGLGFMEKILTANNGGDGWFVGNSMTWADLHFQATMQVFMDREMGDFLDKFVKLKALKSRVEGVPRIAEWINTRPNNSF